MAKAAPREKQFIAEGFLPLHREVLNDFRAAVATAFPALMAEGRGVKIAVSPSQPQFGDYQCNNAMGLYKQFGKEYPDCSTPKAFGDRIAAALNQTHYEKVAVAPAGYVTVTLKSDWLSEIVQHHLIESEEIRCVVDSPQKVGIDFSAPNIAKEMHVGHLRSTIHGESLSRVMNFVGHTVTKVNHIGDWGTQFGMLIEYMSEVYPDFERVGQGAAPPNLGDLNAFYKKSKVRFDEDEDFKNRARRRVVSLQSGEPVARAAWELLVSISMVEFEKVYQRLGITDLLTRGESFYNELIPKAVRMCEEAGIVEVVEGGAKCVFERSPEQRKGEVPLMIVKSDGGYGYDSTDVACIYHRLMIDNFKWFIYVTDKGQEEHFLKVFSLAQRMGWHQPPATRLDHCGLGLVCGDDGKKFKTRSGEVVKLADLLDESVRRAEVEIKSRRDYHLEEELRASAQKIGYAAVKYFDLNQVRTGNYKFNYENMLDPKGNTAVYLFYAYARVCSIFRKCPEITEEQMNLIKITDPSERKLLMQLSKLPEAIESVLEDMSMHRICDYAHETCVAFSEFYQACRIVGSEDQLTRLTLCRAVKRSLQLVFHLLGMEPLEVI